MSVDFGGLKSRLIFSLSTMSLLNVNYTNINHVLEVI